MDQTRQLTVAVVTQNKKQQQTNRQFLNTNEFMCTCHTSANARHLCVPTAPHSAYKYAFTNTRTSISNITYPARIACSNVMTAHHQLSARIGWLSALNTPLPPLLYSRSTNINRLNTTSLSANSFIFQRLSATRTLTHTYIYIFVLASLLSYLAHSTKH